MNAIPKGGNATVVDFSPKGSVLLLAEEMVPLISLRLTQRKAVVKPHKHKGWVSAVNFSPNGDYIVTAAKEEKIVRILDSKTGEEISTIEAGGGVISAVFSPDNKKVAAWSDDDMVRVWEWRSRKELMRALLFVWNKSGNVLGQGDVVFSPDGKILAGALPGQAVHTVFLGRRNRYSNRWYTL